MGAPVMILAASSARATRGADGARRDGLGIWSAGRASPAWRRRCRGPHGEAVHGRVVEGRHGVRSDYLLGEHPAREPPEARLDRSGEPRPAPGPASSMLINFDATALLRDVDASFCTLRVNHLGTSADRKHSMSDNGQKPASERAMNIAARDDILPLRYQCRSRVRQRPVGRSSAGHPRSHPVGRLPRSGRSDRRPHGRADDRREAEALLLIRRPRFAGGLAAC